MGILDFFKKRTFCKGADVEVVKRYKGNDLYLTFKTERGDITFNVAVSTSPTGSRAVLYDCFLIVANRWIQQGMDEDDFIMDMKNIIPRLVDGFAADKVMKQILEQHVSDKGRLVDTDLCTYISEIYMAQIALNGSCNRDVLLEQMIGVAKQNFRSHLFITKYRMTGMGLQPYLVPFSEFVKK